MGDYRCIFVTREFGGNGMSRYHDKVASVSLGHLQGIPVVASRQYKRPHSSAITAREINARKKCNLHFHTLYIL